MAQTDKTPEKNTTEQKAPSDGIPPNAAKPKVLMRFEDWRRVDSGHLFAREQNASTYMLAGGKDTPDIRDGLDSLENAIVAATMGDPAKAAKEVPVAVVFPKKASWSELHRRSRSIFLGPRVGTQYTTVIDMPVAKELIVPELASEVVLTEKELRLRMHAGNGKYTDLVFDANAPTAKEAAKLAEAMKKRGINPADIDPEHWRSFGVIQTEQGIYRPNEREPVESYPDAAGQRSSAEPGAKTPNNEGAQSTAKEGPDRDDDIEANSINAEFDAAGQEEESISEEGAGTVTGPSEREQFSKEEKDQLLMALRFCAGEDAGTQYTAILCKFEFASSPLATENHLDDNKAKQCYKLLRPIFANEKAYNIVYDILKKAEPKLADNLQQSLYPRAPLGPGEYDYDQKKALLTAMKMLAEVDDGAKSKDQIGFNRVLGGIGRELAKKETLTNQEAYICQQFVRMHWKQISKKNADLARHCMRNMPPTPAKLTIENIYSTLPHLNPEIKTSQVKLKDSPWISVGGRFYDVTDLGWKCLHASISTLTPQEAKEFRVHEYYFKGNALQISKAGIPGKTFAIDEMGASAKVNAPMEKHAPEKEITASNVRNLGQTLDAVTAPASGEKVIETEKAAQGEIVHDQKGAAVEKVGEGEQKPTKGPKKFLSPEVQKDVEAALYPDPKAREAKRKAIEKVIASVGKAKLNTPDQIDLDMS